MSQSLSKSLLIEAVPNKFFPEQIEYDIILRDASRRNREKRLLFMTAEEIFKAAEYVRKIQQDKEEKSKEKEEAVSST